MPGFSPGIFRIKNFQLRKTVKNLFFMYLHLYHKTDSLKQKS